MSNIFLKQTSSQITTENRTDETTRLPVNMTTLVNTINEMDDSPVDFSTTIQNKDDLIAKVNDPKLLRMFLKVLSAEYDTADKKYKKYKSKYLVNKEHEKNLYQIINNLTEKLNNYHTNSSTSE